MMTLFQQVAESNAAVTRAFEQRGEIVRGLVARSASREASLMSDRLASRITAIDPASPSSRHGPPGVFSALG